MNVKACNLTIELGTDIYFYFLKCPNAKRFFLFQLTWKWCEVASAIG
jgi:hypothetical protein